MKRAGYIFSAFAALSFGAALPGLAPVLAAVGPTDDATIREAATLVNRKQPAEALGKLSPLRPALAGNVEFDMVYGLAQLDSGNPRQAAITFRRVLTVQPDNYVARAHLARALAATGELDEGRREIVIVRERPDLPPDVRDVMDRNLVKIDEARQQRRQAAAQAQAAARATGSIANPRDAATIRAAAELVRSERADQAFAMLTPLEGRLSGDADYNYVYGVAALDSGHPAQAAVALRHALKLRPDFHLARAELGRALAAMGDYAGAKQEFELVRNVPDLPPVARDALGRQVTAIDAALTAPAAQGQPAGPRVNGYIESSVGYDTNVNSGPSNQTLVIPGLAFLTGGAPLTLLPAAMPKKSAFYELAGGLSVALPINNDWALFSNIAGNVHQLFTNQEFRSALAGGEVGVARQIQGLGTFSLAGIGQTFVLGGSTFRNIFGAAGQWRQRFADTWDASVAVSWLRLQYPNAIGNDTNRYTVTGIVAQRFETPMKPSISLAFNLGKEVAIPNAAVDPATNTAGSFNLMGARLGLEATFLPWLAGFFQTGYEVHQYTVFNQVFLDKRRDSLLDVLAGVEVRFTDNISVRPSVQYSRTESNFELFKTQRWIAQSALRWSF